MGIEVCLVNPKKFRMVPGRKTDACGIRTVENNFPVDK
jgi:hypothetical protein